MSENFPKKPEKRNYQRLDLELPVQIEIDGRRMDTTTENISCGGMFLPSLPEDLKQNADITAEITIPEMQKSIKMSGTVLRVQKNPAHRGSGAAVQFTGLYDDNHLTIDRYIKWKLLH